MAAKGQYNPMIPMNVSGMNKRWEEVRIATGLKAFRQYDCRHTAITRMAEAGVPVSVIMSFAGHISPHMTRHYTHISEQSQDIAMEQTQGYRTFRPSKEPVRTPIRTPAPPPACLPQADAMTTLLQAEIQRQVALALQGMFAGMGNKPGS